MAKWTYPQTFSLQETGSRTIKYDFTQVYDCPNNPSTEPAPASPECCISYLMPFASQDMWTYSHTTKINVAKAYDSNGAEFAINPITFEGKMMTVDFCKVPNNVNCFTIRVNGLCLEMGFQRIDCDIFCDVIPPPQPPNPILCNAQLVILRASGAIGVEFQPNQFIEVHFGYYNGVVNGGDFIHSGTFATAEDWQTSLFNALQADTSLVNYYNVFKNPSDVAIAAKTANTGSNYNFVLKNGLSLYSQGWCQEVIPPPPIVADSYVGIRIEIRNRLIPTTETRVKATYKLSNGTTKTSNTIPIFGELNDVFNDIRQTESFEGQITTPAQILGGAYAYVKGNENHTLTTSQTGSGGDFGYWTFLRTTIDGLGILYDNPLPHPVFSNPTSLTTDVYIPAGIGVLLIAVYGS